MNFTICGSVESAWRDGVAGQGAGLPSEVFYSLRLHQINAFGYREAWAEALLPFVKFDSRDRPYFPVSPETPEAHRHKFLTALALSPGSPGAWEWERHRFHAKDFVDPILAGGIERWADRSLAPEPSWTLQFLSAHLDDKARWQGKGTPLAAVVQDCRNRYLRDFASGALWEPRNTLFCESGLHFLEAVNKLSLRQGDLSLWPFDSFRDHVLSRLRQSVSEVQVLRDTPNWAERDHDGRILRFAISQLLVLGHLMEVCFHPKGLLARRWQKAEWEFLQNAARVLGVLMEIFFDPQVLPRMTPEQRQAAPFPLLHAYSALRKCRDLNGS